MPKFIKWYADKGRADKARRLRNEQRKRNYALTAKYAPREWTLLEHSISDRELSEQIHRSVQAIQIRRSRLKKWLDKGI